MEENKFVAITTLLCEPARAKMLWSLLDGRAYTAGELAIVAGISATSASNHLAKLLKGNLLKVDVQGRHRYYSFATAEVAYVVESLANLAGEKPSNHLHKKKPANGVKYCRTCYDHLAGYIGVCITDAMEQQAILKKIEKEYLVTEYGWEWLAQFGINKNDYINNRRPLTRQCLDWSERRPHLAGQLGAIFLEKALEKDWFRKVKFSRELIITAKGRQGLYEYLKITI